MKRLVRVILALWFLPLAAPAQSPPPPVAAPAPLQSDEESEGYPYIGLAALMSAPTQSLGSIYQWGGGGEVCGGYAFDDNLAVQLQVDNLYYYGSGTMSAYSLRPLAELKLSLDLDDFQPYILLGPGLNIHFTNVGLTTATAVNFASVFGLGTQVPIADDAILYVEGKYTVTYYGSSAVYNGEVTQDIPLEAGMLLAL
jgi:hypothetical protein